MDPMQFLPFLQVATFVFYIWFASQCIGEYRALESQSNAAKAFIALAVVFGLCALSGYLIPFVEASLGFDPPWVVWLHVGLHALLPIAALVLILTHSAHKIMRALDGGER